MIRGKDGTLMMCPESWIARCGRPCGAADRA